SRRRSSAPLEMRAAADAQRPAPPPPRLRARADSAATSVPIAPRSTAAWRGSLARLQFHHALLELTILVLQLLDRVAQGAHLLVVRAALGQLARHLARPPPHAPVELLAL